MKILVLGLGISGMAAVELASSPSPTISNLENRKSTTIGSKKQACLQPTGGIKNNVIGIDSFSSSSLLKFSDKCKDYNNVSILLNYNKDQLPSADLIVLSPGISDNSYLGKLAIESKIKIISEVDFAAQYISIPILAITGTNGKTTTTEMTTKLLQMNGIKAISGGNIGVPLSSIAINCQYDVIVAEISSFQLEHSQTFAPEAAALLNIESDHMDRYATFADYCDTKLKIFNNISKISKMIISLDLLELWGNKFNSEKPLTFSISSTLANIFLKKDAIFFNDDKLIFNLSNLEINTPHNIENFMAAIALVSQIVPMSKLKKSLGKFICEFRNSSHRQEVVAKKDNITYINDSKATNPAALIAALNTFGNKKNICLIAGGLDKKMDFSDVKDHKDKIKTIFIAGESKKALETLWKDDIHCIVCNSFDEAVIKATQNARFGDIVLLSPGCASMDMFKNYKERGEHFISIIHQIL